MIFFADNLLHAIKATWARVSTVKGASIWRFHSIPMQMECIFQLGQR